jgi:hypothetical protein
MTDEQENPLQILVGRKLNSVEFIQDDVYNSGSTAHV